jgi:hypothetical protein
MEMPNNDANDVLIERTKTMSAKIIVNTNTYLQLVLIVLRRRAVGAYELFYR